MLCFARRLSTVRSGAKYSADFAAYLKLDNGKIGSFLHDVPLNLNLKDKTASMVVEIPRWTNGKFEISGNLPANPIVQDTKKGKLRFVNNIYPHHGYPHNYGAFPQTWENPVEKSEIVKDLKGDNDPLDVIDIGSRVSPLGEIKRVKILGSLALIDDGELDWKIIAIDVNDPLAVNLNDIEDVDSKMPHLLSNLRSWFKNYKLPTGKPVNEFAFGGEYRDSEFTMEVLSECVASWKKLVSGSFTGEGIPATKNATLPDSPGFGELDVTLTPPGADLSIPAEVDTIYYYKD